jgi:hypothetical protein
MVMGGRVALNGERERVEWVGGYGGRGVEKERKRRVCKARKKFYGVSASALGPSEGARLLSIIIRIFCDFVIDPNCLRTT